MGGRVGFISKVNTRGNYAAPLPRQQHGAYAALAKVLIITIFFSPHSVRLSSARPSALWAISMAAARRRRSVKETFTFSFFGNTLGRVLPLRSARLQVAHLGVLFECSLLRGRQRTNSRI